MTCYLYTKISVYMAQRTVYLHTNIKLNDKVKTKYEFVEVSISKF